MHRRWETAMRRRDEERMRRGGGDMDVGTGIEVRGEGKRVYVLMPAMPQAFKRRRGRELVDLWVFAFVMAAGGLGRGAGATLAVS